MTDFIKNDNCRMCPRECRTDRSKGQGFCKSFDTLRVARAALHFYEEPFLSGEDGSGAIFFTGCSLQCIYCQNKEISRMDNSDTKPGYDVSPERLSEIFFELKEKGALNINLVTGTHFTDQIAKALSKAKDEGLDIPVIWNCSGYENVDSIKQLEGLVDIYLPDFKTLDLEIAKRYFKATDYPQKAKLALEEYFRQTGPFVMDTSEEAKKQSEDGLMKKGVCVRHLVTPGNIEDSKNVIDYLYDTYKDDIWISVMSQYTPMEKYPYEELNRKVSEKEYEEVVEYIMYRDVINCMIQEGDAADESFIPHFNGEGVIK